jgi:hypothetical protein
MQDIISSLCERGYSEVEAENLISKFIMIERKTKTGRTIRKIMGDLITVMDEYYRRHGEYVKLEFPAISGH